jgi:hypothetical protein
MIALGAKVINNSSLSSAETSARLLEEIQRLMNAPK